MISVLRAAFVFYSHLKCLGSLALSPHSPGQVTAPPPTPPSPRQALQVYIQAPVPACASDRHSCPDPLPSSFPGFGKGGAF